MVFRQYIIWAVVLLGLCGTRVNGAVSIDESRWGFSNTVVEGKLNILSVRLFNDGEEPYEGVVSLEKLGYQGRVGAKLLQPIFITPHTERWVQFYAYVGKDHPRWKVQVGRGNTPNSTLELPRPNRAPPARVFLQDGSSALVRQVKMPTFPDYLFPASIPALDSLHSLVLAHAPDWQAPRRQALRDWIYTGGTVHVYQRPEGDYPEFIRELDFINDAQGATPFGGGWVVKHDAPRSAVRTTIPGYPMPESLKGNQQGNAVVYTGLDQFLFTHLRKLVLPNHNWGLIAFLAVLYVLLIGPVNYVLALRWKNHFKSIGLFLACLVIFSIAFALVGERGFGEKSNIHSLRYVRPLENGQCDVTEWSNVFSARGRMVNMVHGGKTRYYSTASRDQSVPGQIINGVDGQLQMEMPIFSYAQTLMRAKLPGADLAAKLTAGSVSQPGSLRFAVPPDLPETYVFGWAWIGKRLYPVTREGAQLVVTESEAKNEHKLIDDEMRRQMQQAGYSQRFRMVDRREEEIKPMVERQAPALLAIIESVVQKNSIFPVDYRMPERMSNGRIDLFLVTEGTPAFDAQVVDFANDSGYMIIHQVFNATP